MLHEKWHLVFRLSNLHTSFFLVSTGVFIIIDDTHINVWIRHTCTILSTIPSKFSLLFLYGNTSKTFIHVLGCTEISVRHNLDDMVEVALPYKLRTQLFSFFSAIRKLGVVIGLGLSSFRWNCLPGSSMQLILWKKKRSKLVKSKVNS